MEGIERKLLACFMQSKTAWSRVRDKLDDKLFEGALYTKAVLGYIDEFYAKDGDAPKVDVEVLVALVTSRMDTIKHRDMVVQLLKELSTLEVSVDNIIELALEIKRKEIGSQLGLAIMNGQASEKQQKLMEEYQALLDASSLEEAEDEQEHYNNLSVADIVRTTLDKNALIKFLPKSLNESIDGGALAGHHVTFFARPEAGKTAAMMTMLYGFLLQGLDVIYMGNEDPLLQIIQRAMTCITGMTKEDIANNPDRAEQILAKRNWPKARFIPLTPGSVWEIDKYVKRYKPAVCIVDQMRNITSKAGTKAEQLEEAAKGIRQIGKKYNCLMITVTQAGDSASGKLVLDMGDISDSNTGIPAQCDVLVGMGLTAEYESQGMRMLATPKNKLSGKHVHWPVKILSQISRLEDV